MHALLAAAFPLTAFWGPFKTFRGDALPAVWYAKRMAASERIQERMTATDNKLWWLIGGRLLAAAVLLFASWLWVREHLAGPDDVPLPGGAMLILAGVLALSTVYAVVLRLAPAYWRSQAVLQVVADVLLITWLVWLTGDVRSPYAGLYIIIISVASIFLGPRGALVTALGCDVAFTAIAMGTTTGVVPHYALGTVETSALHTIQTIGLNDVAFLVVGLLAARFAERQSRSDVRLIAATQSLANLRALHQRIVESIRSGVVTTDLDGRIYTFNAAAEEITGYRAVDMRGEDASIIFGDFKSNMAGSIAVAAAGQPSPRFETFCLTPDGLRLLLGYSIFPLFEESGETTGLVITFQDLTELRALEETSRRQDRLAAVGRVAAGIAHEIRNPLASMRGAIQVLQAEMNGDSQNAQLMSIVLRESDRLNGIITDFLTYARPQASSLSQIDLREPLSETFTLLRHSPEMSDSHTLQEEVPDKPVQANADPAQLRQVFWNLARNALQAMPDGGTLRAELKPAGPGRVRLTFTDTGCGMTAEQVEHLFEPFSSARAGGTGLGLSIVYQIIRDHGGTINVRSREGQGTTIAIELPAVLQG